MSLLKLIAKYEERQQEYISHLEEENATLKAKISEMINQGMKDAAASQSALLQGILSGAISKPKEEKSFVCPYDKHYGHETCGCPDQPNLPNTSEEEDDCF